MKKCISVFTGIENDECLCIIKQYGFDGFFSDEKQADDIESLKRNRRLADEYNLFYETSHATIPGCDMIWKTGEEGEAYTALLHRNLDNCYVNKIPILVVHIAAPNTTGVDFQLGTDRLRPIIAKAHQYGIKIAFENINAPDLLIKTLSVFTDSHIGFCYDCGHEACHTPGVHYLPIIGNRMICTHIHDNHGKYDEHLIPFDGALDFERIAHEMSACKYQGNVSLEVGYFPSYAQRYTKEEYILHCHSSLIKFVDMIKNR